MGVKSTVILTRAEAEKKFRQMREELELARMRKLIELEARALMDVSLENELEEMNDRRNGGEGFENYLIRSDRHAD